MSPAAWRPLLWGRWAVADHITLGDSRTVVKLLALLASDFNWHRSRIISLQDNRPTAGALTKGRSAAPALNLLCRQKAAYGLAAQIQVLLPWVESSKMPADDLSRDVPMNVAVFCSADSAASKAKVGPQG